MNITGATQRRPAAAALLLALSLILSLVFYGTAANLLILALVVAVLLSSLVVVGSSSLSQLLDCNRAGFLLALSILGYLIVAYRFTLSPDSSFAPSWVLAAGPIAFICAAAVARSGIDSRVLTVPASVLVVALAANSCLRFVL